MSHQSAIEYHHRYHHTDHPHRLYSISLKGSWLIEDGNREGVCDTHGRGDLEESSLHVLGIVLGRQLAQSAFIDNSDSTTVERFPTTIKTTSSAST